MTKGEIQLVVFLALALATGAMVKWWRGRETRALPVPPAKEAESPRWAKAPYVFKTEKGAREAQQREGK